MQPVVVAFCGLPGSGKSTLAAALAEATDWLHLDRDRLRQQVTGIGYQVVDKRVLAEMMRARMLQSLFAGRSVIVDGMTFSSRRERERFRDTAEIADARWQLVWLDCQPELARARIQDDVAHPAVDRDASLVDAVHARFDPPTDAIRLDATRPPAEQLKTLLKEFAQ